MLFLILLLLFLIFFGAGFALHVLWWVLIAIVIVALVSMILR